MFCTLKTQLVIRLGFLSGVIATLLLPPVFVAYFAFKIGKMLWGEWHGIVQLYTGAFKTFVAIFKTTKYEYSKDSTKPENPNLWTTFKDAFKVPFYF